MHLSGKQSERFYALLNMLTLFANEHCQLDEDLIRDNFGRFDDDARRSVADVLWNNLDIIDSFVVANPFKLDTVDLETILLWKDALCDHFILMEHTDGKSRFVNDGGVFEVVGITQDIDELVSETPTYVQTTLLPFDGKIVYSAQIMSNAVSFGAGALSMFDDIYAKQLERGIVSTASDFAARSRAYRAERSSREIEKLEKAMNRGADIARNGEPLCEGHHRGMLAGLSEEEREEAIGRAVKDADIFPESVLVEIAQSRAVFSEPVTSLKDVLAGNTKEALLHAASAVGLESARSCERPS